MSGSWIDGETQYYPMLLWILDTFVLELRENRNSWMHFSNVAFDARRQPFCVRVHTVNHPQIQPVVSVPTNTLLID